MSLIFSHTFCDARSTLELQIFCHGIELGYRHPLDSPVSNLVSGKSNDSELCKYCRIKTVLLIKKSIS